MKISLSELTFWISLVHILQCVLERTDAIKNEVLEPIAFDLAYPLYVHPEYISIIIAVCYLSNTAPSAK